MLIIRQTAPTRRNFRARLVRVAWICFGSIAFACTPVSSLYAQPLGRPAPTPTIHDPLIPSSPFDRPVVLHSPVPVATADSVPRSPAERVLTSPTPIRPPTESVTAGAPPSQINELLAVEIELGEASVKANDSEESRSQLLVAYEKALLSTCYRDFAATLQLPPAPPGGECQRFIEETLQLNAGNPVAVCARVGIDSPVCAQAYTAQVVQPYNPAREQSGRASAEEVLEARGSESRRAVMESFRLQLGKLDHDSSGKRKDPKVRAKYDAIYTKMIDEVCRIAIPRIDFESKKKMIDYRAIADGLQVGRSTPLSAPRKPQSGPLWDLDLESPHATPTPQALSDPLAPLFKPRDGERRILQVPRDCIQTVNSALVLNKELAPAVCWKFGRHSPTCVQALRRARGAVRPGRRAAPVPESEEIATF